MTGTDAPAPATSSSHRTLICACFAASGTAGLVLEIVWSKYLSLLSGNSSYGVATVVAAFLGGLGLGAWYGGRLSERTREPLVAYARLEAIVAVLGLVSPFAYAAGKPAIAWLYDATGGGTAFLVLRLVLLFVALLPPTLAMGASLPLVASDFARRGAAFGSSVGRLYAWNTAGAVLGVVLAGFALIPIFGLARTAVVASVIDLLVAAAILAGRPAAPPDAVLPAAESPASQSPSPVFTRLVVPLFAVSGFTAILYEIAWTRVLSVPLGGMVYSLSAILAVYLAGLAIGAAVASSVLARIARPVLLFGVCQVLVAAVVVGGGHLFAEIPVWMASLVSNAATAPIKLALGELGIVAIVVLPASILFGAVFPVAAAIRHQGRGAGGATVGGLYAANTFGSIAGSIVTGFVLVPWIGCLRATLCAAAVNVAIGAVSLAFAELPRRRRSVACGAVVVAALIVSATCLPVWRAHRMTVGFARLVRDALFAGPGSDALPVIDIVDAVDGDERLVYYDEGRSASVAVLETGGDTVLVVNGKPDASTGAIDDMVTQVMAGQLPLLFAPSAKDVCIIGYGSGVTTHAVLTHPVREVVTIEIEEAVIRAAPHFRGAAFEPLGDPRSRLVIDDAGTFLRATARDFDVIVSEPSNPWLAGVADLFTSEFYDEVAARLRPGGVLTQWVQCYEISRATRGVVLRTLAKRFPHGQVFYFRAGDMVIVASPDREMPIDPVSLAAAFERTGVDRDMGRIGIKSVADVLRCYVGTLERLAARAGDGPVNTDDNGWLEHHAPLDVVGGTWEQDFGTPEEIGGDLFSSLPRDSAQSAQLSMDLLERATEVGDLRAGRVAAEALDRMGRRESDEVDVQMDILERNVHRNERAVALWREAVPLVTRAAENGDHDAAARAVELLEKAAKIHRLDGQIAWDHGWALFVAGRIDESIVELSRAVALIPQTAAYAAHKDLAIVTFAKKDFDACLREAAAIDVLKPGSAEACTWRVKVHHARGDLDAARAELTRGLAADPGSHQLEQLGRALSPKLDVSDPTGR